MIVTDLKYHLENRLIPKLDIMLERTTNPQKRKDGVLIVEGSEGEGKTNTSEAIAYYWKWKGNKEIYMFFRLKGMIEFAKQTEGKIIIWDEPSLDSLSTDWWREANMDLIRLLMTCRKKRHLFIFNFTKFFKFNEYVVVDRALGLIHMYSRDGVQSGRFAYIRQKNLQNLFTDYKTKKKREYRKYRAFGGSFPVVENKLAQMGITIEGVPNCDLAMYEKLKDKAIESIGRQKIIVNPEKKKLKELKNKIGKLKFPIKTQEEFAKLIEITPKTMQNWAKNGGSQENEGESA